LPDKRAVLFDPHPLLLDTLEGILGRLDVVAVAKATTFDEAIASLRAERPDIIVADLDALPASIEPPEFLARCLSICSEIRAVVLSRDERWVEQALAAGAAAYVLKRAHVDDLSSAVRQAFEGGIFYTAAAQRRRPSPVTRWPYETAALTKRELEILRLAAEGKSNGELARTLWVTEQTVKFHLSNVYRKLGVSNRTEAGLWAHNNGLLAAAAVPGETA
jgi:two-component system, NarL family, response regulator DevR